MIIAISGTPGTGKTETAKVLKKLLDAELVDIKKIAVKLSKNYDKERKTLIVAINKIQKTLDKKLKKCENKYIILDSHLSHLLKSDLLVILRTRPDVLKKRMQKRKWSKRKIQENVECEILDVTTTEALNKHEKDKSRWMHKVRHSITEIDTSNKKPRSIALLIKNIIENPNQKNKYEPGKIDWLEKHFDLIK